MQKGENIAFLDSRMKKTLKENGGVKSTLGFKKSSGMKCFTHRRNMLGREEIEGERMQRVK